MALDALNAISLFKPVTNVAGIERVGGGGGARKVTGANPFAGGGAVTFGSNGTGELVSNYGPEGASAAAYKGLSNDPTQTVGAKFDTARLGIYGF